MTLSLLEQGISAAQSGRREEARSMLIQVVQTDERNEEAWVWLAGMVDDPEDMRTCLENALHLNPDNTKAQQGLAWVEQRHGPRPVVESTPAPAPQPAPQSAAAILAMLEQPAQLSQAPESAPETSVLPSGSTPYRSLHERPIVSTSDPLAEAPCLYCGASLRLKQKRCSECDKSQVFRAEPEPHKGSKAMTFMAWCWLFPVVVGYAYIMISLFIGVAENISQAGLGGLLLIIIGVIIFTGLYLLLCAPVLLLARGLYRCKRWAFILQTIWTMIEVALYSIALFITAKAPGGLSAAVNNPALQQRSWLLASTMIVWGGIALTIGWRVFICVLIWFGHGAVYGRRLRMLPIVKVAAGNYNNGLDYRKRGMWYMAVQEWEGAVLSDPRELEYLHTLGLGYAQIKQFERARAMLDSALKLAPSDTRIADSRALVEQLEQGKRR